MQRLACYDGIFLSSAAKKVVPKPRQNVVSVHPIAPDNIDVVTNKVFEQDTQHPSANSGNSGVIKSADEALAAISIPLNAEVVSNIKSVPEESVKSAINSVPSPEDLFGAEQLKGQSTSTPDEVAFTVTNISENRNKIRTFTFSNGQTWRESSNTGLRVKLGDTVIISKGAFTSYFLSKEGINRKTQVRRIR
ncbi:hypothetical protein KJ365_06245 [Glaciecola sp. XM2]|uniref:hypothetical protein n=1 Tax=Glaciecola sp. XM2 TaxID=1914931 RepID=UPI001BDDFF36|nr:hypothetical protein [Glaciecola sp. XM2]MBT1450478.1 hypothetical protein [Glaciecola sp. XM2]